MISLRVGLVAALLTVGAPDSRCQDAMLQGTVTDAATGALAPCTVSITDAHQRLVIENDSFRSGFRCDGQFTKTLPPGRTRLRVTRGFETRAIEKTFDLAPGQTLRLEMVLDRRVDLRKRGWYAGDSHAHMLHGERLLPVSFDFVARTAQAEDLQYLCLAQAWQLPNPTPEALEAQLQPRSTPGCVLAWNLEAPKNYYRGDAGRCLGHCWNLGLRGRTADGADVIRLLLDASAWDYESQKPTYGNFESHRLIHLQGGAVFYTHPARWWMGPWGGQGGYPKTDRMRVSNLAVELPLDTVLGPTFDGLDVITGPGELEANDKAFALWSELLNHGYRLAATGSSDACFDRPGGGVPGVPRTYTYLRDGFSLTKVTDATRAGHTFVTTGPLLLATVDRQPPGSAFGLSRKRHVLAIEAWACGEDPGGIEQLEVLRNGQLFQSWRFPGHPAHIFTNLSFQQPTSGWMCLRLRQDSPANRRAITGAFYFGPFRPPPPVQGQIRVQIVDEQTGRPLRGWVTEMDFQGPVGHAGKGHRISPGGSTVRVPGTVRLRAQADGYRPLVLSPVFDNPKLVDRMTRLSDTDLLNWSTFEQIRQEFADIHLEFRLKRAVP